MTVPTSSNKLVFVVISDGSQAIGGLCYLTWQFHLSCGRSGAATLLRRSPPNQATGPSPSSQSTSPCSRMAVKAMPAMPDTTLAASLGDGSSRLRERDNATQTVPNNGALTTAFHYVSAGQQIAEDNLGLSMSSWIQGQLLSR